MKINKANLLMNIGSLWLAVVVFISGFVMIGTEALDDSLAKGLSVFVASFLIFGFPGIILVVIGITKQRAAKQK